MAILIQVETSARAPWLLLVLTALIDNDTIVVCRMMRLSHPKPLLVAKRFLDDGITGDDEPWL